jgi:hypothetical protein
MRLVEPDDWQIHISNSMGMHRRDKLALKA